MNIALLSDRAITRGFILAGLVNIVGMLVVSRFFTNSLLNATDPAVFSWLGQVSIVLWGLAYLAVAKAFRHVPYVVLTFFVEKVVYTVAWLVWLSKHGQSLPAIAAESPMTASFFRMYGAGDFIFALFFGYVTVKLLKAAQESTSSTR